ncbi:MAG: UDP-N-acetylmuramoyl-L-alanine--D-glutamate ligase [Candidatus Omnitrophota bacterium]
MLNVKGKKVLILGFGESGYAASKLMLNKGAFVKISDNSDSPDVSERLKSLDEFSVRYETGGHTSSFCSDAEIVVVSPGIDIEVLKSTNLFSKEALVLGELELGFLFCPAPIVAVTGTNGKTTTTELIGKIFSCAGKHTIVCGNIGNPLSGEVEFLTEDSIAVVEVSSFQLQTIKDFRPRVAVLLNITDDHYERHGNYANYQKEKFKIFKNQTNKDYAVINSVFLNDPIVDSIKSRIVYFAKKEGDIVVNVDDGSFILRENEILLKGRHNRDNVEGAVCAALAMGIDEKVIRSSVSGFKGLGHRLEGVFNFNGIDFIDDSKATNVGAVYSALESIDKKVVLIAGGRDKGGNYDLVMPLVKEKVKAMVLMGEAQKKIKQVFNDVVPVFSVSGMKEAVCKSISLAKRGEAVILSPMCSSFDMFSSYKERGKAFQEEVKKQYETASDEKLT